MAARFADVAANIMLPTLYVRGAMSELVSPADAAAFVGSLPDGELVEVQDLALVVTDDCNDVLGAHLIDFPERRAPRRMPEYRAGSDARTSRDALACFATGGTVVTRVYPDGTPVGPAANRAG